MVFAAVVAVEEELPQPVNVAATIAATNMKLTNFFILNPPSLMLYVQFYYYDFHLSTVSSHISSLCHCVKDK